MSRKVGDRVKIICSKEISGMIGFVECMKRYCGRVATIKRKYGYKEGNYYRIDIDEQTFLWGDYMFEGKVKGLLKNE